MRSSRAIGRALGQEGAGHAGIRAVRPVDKGAYVHATNRAPVLPAAGSVARFTNPAKASPARAMTVRHDSRQVVFVGLCQTQALGRLYQIHIAPWLNDRVSYVLLDPWRQGLANPAGQDTIRQADVVVEQKFDSPSLVPAGLIGAGVPHVWHPYVSAGFLWPYHTEPHVVTAVHPWRPLGAYGGELGDRFLNRMIREQVPPAEAARRYLDHDIVAATRLDRAMELSLEMQRRRDRGTGIDIAGVLARDLRHQYMFHGKGHPAEPVYRLQARHVFAALGVPANLIAAAEQAAGDVGPSINQAPVHPRVAEHLGLGYIRPDQRYRHNEEGAFTFAESVERYIDHVWVPALSEGLWLQRNARPAEAVPKLRDGLARCPGSLAGWRALGTALAELARPAEAQAALHRALGLEPQDPATLVAIARLALRRGDIAAAEQYAHAAAAVAPYDQQSHIVLAHALAAGDQQRQAVAAARHAWRLGPGEAWAVVTYARQLRAAGDLDAAERLVRAALTRHPDDDGLIAVLVDLLSDAARFHEAAALAERHAAAAPDSAARQTRLGQIRLAGGDIAGAIAAFRDALRLEPANPRIATALGRALETDGRGGEAIPVLQALADDGSGHAPLHFQLGFQHQRAGDLAAAEAALRQALHLDPALHGAATVLADVLSRSGRDDEALALLRPLASQGSRDPYLYAGLARLHERAGDIESATAAIRRCLEIAPALAGPRATLARLEQRAAAIQPGPSAGRPSPSPGRRADTQRMRPADVSRGTTPAAAVC